MDGPLQAVADALAAPAAPGAAAAEAASASDLPPPALAPRPAPAVQSLLLFHAIVKRHNIGTMLRSAAAFGVSEALVSGAAFRVFGAKGAERHVPTREFARFGDAVAHLRARGVALCGIEIARGAVDVATRPFSGSTCFLAGNEGAGLSEEQKAACDLIVYVRQCGHGTASLNVATATAIVLHHFAEWAQFSETPREEGRDKFVVEKAKEGERAALSDVVSEKRRARAEAARGDEWEGDRGWGEGEGQGEEEGETE